MDTEYFHGRVMQLQGVDEYTGSIKKWDDYFEACQCIRFKLDGVVYVAMEDPSDGYRSYLGELKIDEEEIKNPFSGVEVKGVYRTRSGDPEEDWTSKSCSILDLVDTTTNEVVVSIGTDNDDDYYPWFVGYFDPKAMSVNK
jgi:hypothetical protein